VLQKEVPMRAIGSEPKNHAGDYSLVRTKLENIQ